MQVNSKSYSLNWNGKSKNLYECKKLIDSGITGTKDLSVILNQSERQTRRHIKKLAAFGLVKLDMETGRMEKSTENVLKKQYNSLSDGTFRKIPEIQKWVNDCIARELHPKSIANMVNAMKRLCGYIKIHPKKLVTSKKIAKEYWTTFMVEYKKQNPAKGTHMYRVSYKNFLASFEMTFAHGSCKTFGLSSAHDRFGTYAGVHFSSAMTKKLGDIILSENDLETFLWFRIGLRTGARSSAISSMVWERIYVEKNEDGTELFKLEQHETKDKRGQYHLGLDGDWKIKYPPPDLQKNLLQWKQDNPRYTRFVWFEDRGYDIGNLSQTIILRNRIASKLKKYYKKIENEVDFLTRQYMYIKPDHIMRHTFAQQLKESGFTSEEIAEAGGWRDAGTVSKWYSKTSEKKKRELGIRCTKVVF
jgi:integrase